MEYLQEIFLPTMLEADLTKSFAVGRDPLEIEVIKEMVLGTMDQHRRPLDPPEPPADVFIVDQNLGQSPEGKEYKGTSIIADLIDAGFKGFVCLRTANTSQQVRSCHVMSCLETLRTSVMSLKLNSSSPVSSRLRILAFWCLSQDLEGYLGTGEVHCVLGKHLSQDTQRATIIATFADWLHFGTNRASASNFPVPSPPC